MRQVEIQRSACSRPLRFQFEPSRGYRCSVLVATLLLLTALFAPGYARAQGGPSHFVLPATAAEHASFAMTGVRADVGVSRQRPVALELPSLDDRQKAASTMLVELFDGQSVTLAKDRVERRGDGNYTWHGKLAGHSNGFAVITVVDGQVSGMIDLGETGRGQGRYQIQSGSDGITVLREINASAFPDDHPSAGELQAPRTETKTKLRVAADGTVEATTAEGTIVKADSAATIDVMILFSNQSASAAGAAMGAQAQQAVDTANLVYANSGITTRLRLVYAGPANYDESGDFNTDLNRLTSGTDGYMDNVAALRDSYGADLVSLFVENGQYCGLGWIGPSAAYAFTVINRGCASGNLSYPHELGHNFGARHDVYVDSATTPYSYGHGWVDVGQGWRDVMAYNNACAAYGTNCVRIAYLSNPSVTYGSPPDPTGSTSTADTARVHNQNALTVANFRASKQGGGTPSCTWSLSPGSASVGAAVGTGSIGVTTQAGCAWNAASNAGWLTTGASLSGAGTFSYSYGANSGPARSGTITIGGVAFNVSQASGCTYALSTSSASTTASGGSGSTTLSTTASCSWTASSSAAWLAVTSGSSGSGNATVTYTVATNTGSARSANLTIGGQTLLVSQAAATTVTQASALASITPASMDFGTVVVGKASSAKTAILSNAGGGSLTVSSVALGGANVGDFALAGTCASGATLSAGQSCTISVTFRPTQIGPRTASISVTTSAGSANISVVGTGGKKGGRR